MLLLNNLTKALKRVALPMLFSTSIFGLTAFVVTTIHGQSNQSESSTKSIENMAWLVGSWQGEMFGGIGEEVWQPESGGAMVGTFRLIHGNDVGFYELMIISEDSTGLVFRIKHFNADLTGWEKKDEMHTFPFVSANERKILFEGMSYELLTPDSLMITLTTVQESDSTKQQLKFARSK